MTRREFDLMTYAVIVLAAGVLLAQLVRWKLSHPAP